jgi:hypothetical protein
MKDELVFPLSFEDHLKEIIPDRCAEERDNIKAALRKCYHIGVTEIQLDTYGSGDSGEGTDIEVYPDHLRGELTEYIKTQLRYYGWRSTRYLNPGYEINEGGGCTCTITFYPFTGVINAYVYEITQHNVKSLTLSALENQTEYDNEG